MLQEPVAASPFRSRVAQFYRAKGYGVKEEVRVRGASGSVYAVAMVAEGPLGALLVSFGDAAGVDGPEVGRVRTLARDVGATPVVASPALSAELRRLAAQMGVVVVEEATLDAPVGIPAVPAPVGPDPLGRDLEAHPWPASGRAHPFPDAGAVRAVDVDDLLADLEKGGHFGAPAEPAALRSAPPPPVGPAKPPRPFAWLHNPVTPVQQANPVGGNGGAGEAAPLPAPSGQAPAAAAAGQEMEAIPPGFRIEEARPLTRRVVVRAVLWGCAIAAALLVLFRLFG